MLLLADDALFDEHASRGYHPERPERLAAARRAVERVASEVVIRRLAARDASTEEIARAHEEEYVEALERVSGRWAALDADTFVAPASVRAARRAAGAAIAVVDALRADPAERGIGLALLRPPGHHATRERGMGFCLFNNAAVAAHWALAQGIERVAVVDWDVHHGNGTQDIFWTDPRVLYLSVHQSPLYPGTGAAAEVGEGDGHGTTGNVPLSPGAGDAAYAEVFSQIVEPALEAFAPQLVLVSAGFDAHERDPLAAMRVTDAGFAAMARGLARVARRSAGGRLAFLLEGGYDLGAIEGALAATIRAALGLEHDHDAAALREAGPPLGALHAEEIGSVRRVLERAGVLRGG